jgi:hypothetical protein
MTPRLESILAASVLMLGASIVHAATPAHQYELNGSLTDDFGGPALVSNGGTLSATGYTFGNNQGLTLNAGVLGDVYTVDLSYHFDTHSGWQKIIDFSNLNADAGMYTLDAKYDFYPVTDAGAAPSDGVDGHLTLTRDASKTVSIYADGALVGSFVDTSNYADFTGNSANFFIDDVATGRGEAASGHVDYIRTWNTALSSSDVAQLAPVPEPESYAMLLAGLGLMGVVARRRTK